MALTTKQRRGTADCFRTRNINPAVTLTNAILRRHPWRKVPTYWLAQLLGAMTAAAALWGNYRSAIDAYEGDMSTLTVPLTGSNHSTAGIFATYPADVSNIGLCQPHHFPAQA